MADLGNLNGSTYYIISNYYQSILTFSVETNRSFSASANRKGYLPAGGKGGILHYLFPHWQGMVWGNGDENILVFP